MLPASESIRGTLQCQTDPPRNRGFPPSPDETLERLFLTRRVRFLMQDRPHCQDHHSERGPEARPEPQRTTRTIGVPGMLYSTPLFGSCFCDGEMRLRSTDPLLAELQSALRLWDSLELA